MPRLVWYTVVSTLFDDQQATAFVPPVCNKSILYMFYLENLNGHNMTIYNRHMGISVFFLMI